MITEKAARRLQMIKAIPCAGCGRQFLTDGRSLCIECLKKDEHRKRIEENIDKLLKNTGREDMDKKQDTPKELRAAVKGDKHDSCKYDKVDLSLIPIEIFMKQFTEDSLERDLFIKIHQMINGQLSSDHIKILFYDTIEYWGFHDLAVSLGYGVVKYGRNNWRKGFGGEYIRFLKAALRHLLAMMMGTQYDSENKPGYPRGNSHKGAAQFAIMVAMYELAEYPIEEERNSVTAVDNRG